MPNFASDYFPNKPWLCPTPNVGLSFALTSNDYDTFIKLMSYKIRESNARVEHINIKCEGQCPKGCDEKFKLKLGKSLTKKSFDKIREHCEKYPEHCLTTKWDGVVW